MKNKMDNTERRGLLQRLWRRLIDWLGAQLSSPFTQDLSYEDLVLDALNAVEYYDCYDCLSSDIRFRRIIRL